MVLCDTGFWVALSNPKDRYYSRAVEIAQQLDEDPITTWPVITETCYLLQQRISQGAASAFIHMLFQQQIEIHALQTDDLPRVAQTMDKYADLPMALSDASLVILAEELGHGRILSTDQRDFNSYRWKNHHPFQNLLLSVDL